MAASAAESKGRHPDDLDLALGAICGLLDGIGFDCDGPTRRIVRGDAVKAAIAGPDDGACAGAVLLKACVFGSLERKGEAFRRGAAAALGSALSAAAGRAGERPAALEACLTLADATKSLVLRSPASSAGNIASSGVMVGLVAAMDALVAAGRPADADTVAAAAAAALTPPDEVVVAAARDADASGAASRVRAAAGDGGGRASRMLEALLA